MYFKTQSDLDNYLKRLKEPSKSKYFGLQIGPGGWSDDEALDALRKDQTPSETTEEEENSDIAPDDAHKSEENEQEDTKTEEAPKEYYDTDGDFTWAKDAEIKNVGEEIEGAARHSRNKGRDWGTIDELVAAKRENLSRKDLAELYPDNIKEMVSESDDAFNNEVLLVQLMLLAYPPKTPSADSAERYASLYVEVKELAEKSLQDRFDSSPSKMMYQLLRDKLMVLIKSERHQHKGMDTEFSAALVRYYNRLRPGVAASPFTIAKDVDQKTIEDFLSDISYEQKQQLKYCLSQRARGQQAEIPPEVQDAFIGLSKALSDGKKEFIRSGKPRVVKKRETSSSDRQNVREQDFYKDFVPNREASKDVFHDHKEAMDFMSSKARFRLIEFGNSMPDAERATHLKASATALSDLSSALGLSSDKLSFGGTLAIAFGSRGSRGALATYIRQNGGKDKIINITRNNGYGSLAHEWGHALSDSVGRNGHGIRGVTDPESLAPEFRSQQYLQDVRSAISDSGIRNRIRQNDEFRNKFTYRAQSYWLESEELYARFFEVYIERKLGKQGVKNTYLTAGARNYLWPTAEEVEKLEPYFDKLIKSVGGMPAQSK